jgi:hypothetical protein
MPTDRVPDFQLGVGDNLVAMDFTITDAFGNYIDITGATVTLSVSPLNETSGPVAKTGSVTGTTPQTKARYTWLSADTVAAGLFEALFLVTVSGERITWPTARLPLLIQIGEP